MIRIEYVIFGAAILILLSVIAGKFSSRLGIPALLLFLGVGILAGSEGIGGIYYDDAYSAQLIGTLALSFILFAGGMETRWKTIRPALKDGILLSTVGVLVTTVSVGVFTAALFQFRLVEGLLLGAIVSCTDAAAVFSVLRGQRIRLKGRLEAILELESGSNDPMAVFLTLALIQLILIPETGALDLITLFIRQFAIGGVCGAGAALLMRETLNRLRLSVDGLYPVITVGFVLLTFGATASVSGSGFLAVYLAGLILGQQEFRHKQSLMSFHEALAWLMQILMFLTLGLLVFPSQVIAQADNGVLVALFLIVVGRPLSVMISLAFSGLSWRHQAMIAWVGLRGAAPIIIATFPLLAGVQNATTIFNVVFFVVLSSILLQGTTLVWVAKRLGVYDESPPPPEKMPIQFTPSESMQSAIREFVVKPDSQLVGKQIVNMGLPEGSLIVLIGRSGTFIVPNGGSIIAIGDQLLMLTRSENLTAISQMCEC